MGINKFAIHYTDRTENDWERGKNFKLINAKTEAEARAKFAKKYPELEIVYVV